jgi:hypothetical protein
MLSFQENNFTTPQLLTIKGEAFLSKKKIPQKASSRKY